MNVYEKLSAVQTELKAPKGQLNSFGGYKYRSCEDILEALKPLLEKYKATIYITDSVKMIGERYYIEAIVNFVDVENNDDKIKTVAYAREEATKKGMDGSQITGASSSYARKYALNGMFSIDDTEDSDATNDGKDKGNKENDNEKQPANAIDYRTEYIKICKEKGVDSIVYAQENGITKQTTNAQFKAVCDKLQNKPIQQGEPKEKVVSLDDM